MIKGQKCTKEQKERMRLSHLGKHLSKEAKKKLSEYRTGKKLSEESKEKVRQARLKRKKKLGYINSDEAREKMSKKMKGFKVSEQTKEKIKKNNVRYWEGKKRPELSGKNCHFWKGGINPVNDTIRKSLELKLWRKAVFERDNWTCQKYGTKGKRIQAHHVKNFADCLELRTAIENGITFSEKAHKEFHKKYGVKNNTIEQLREFLLCQNKK